MLALRLHNFAYNQNTTTRDPGGRSFLTAVSRYADVLWHTRHFGNQDPPSLKLRRTSWSPSRGATRDTGGRAFLRALLRNAKVICHVKYSGDQECSPSGCASRCLGGRSSSTAVLREAKIVGDAQSFGDRGRSPSHYVIPPWVGRSLKNSRAPSP